MAEALPFFKYHPDPLKTGSFREWYEEQVHDLVQDGSVQGYLFQCLHCGKHLLHIDCD